VPGEENIMSNTQQSTGAATSAEKHPVIHPKLHHVTFKTAHLQAMIDFYKILVGAEVIFQYEMGAWLTNDEANHRIGMLAFPNIGDDPAKEVHTGLHHSAFEYGSIDALLSTYQRLKEASILPAMCLDHGMTTSFYYQDPDGNYVEMQVDNFEDWTKSKEFMKTAQSFAEDPVGKPVDPEKLVVAWQQGLTLAQIHERAYAGQYLPAVMPPLPQAQ
jgi:catechol 2,3-dioxygenase